MREGVGAAEAHWPRPGWFAAILLFFCLPLFVNLGTPDLDNDEAIYSSAVDRMVATGEWLVPRAIPYGDSPFLEKPPLKFWLVALPMRAGWLPADEFGLRFWDAVFGAASFLYVFLIGAWLLNPACGFVACFLLFAHAPLVFSHGLRANTMDSAVVLAYCGGIYHYLRTTNGRRPFQAFAVALYFVLGFMTKFVAAAFLPLILGVTAVAVPEHRRLAAREWRSWALAGVVALVLIAPWFVFASVRFGSGFWQTLLGVHVYQRFTATLDPGHLHPWHYYLGQMFAFWESGPLLLMITGFAIVAGWTAWRYGPSAVVLVVWLVLPLAVISTLTSKLYHYAFPFLPALALMGGYAATLVPSLGWATFDRTLDRAYAGGAARFPRVMQFLRRRGVRVLLVVAIAVSIALAVGGVVFGRVDVTIRGTELASAGVLRPGLAAFMFGALLMPPQRFRRWLLLLLVGSLLPIQGYRDSIALLGAGVHPRRSVSGCIRTVQAEDGASRGLRVDEPSETISHSVVYYFARIQPWRHGPGGAAGIPALVRLPLSASEPAVPIGEGMAVTLPPAYARCGGVAGS